MYFGGSTPQSRFVDWQRSLNCYQSQKGSTKSDRDSLEMVLVDIFIVLNKKYQSTVDGGQRGLAFHCR